MRSVLRYLSAALAILCLAEITDLAWLSGVRATITTTASKVVAAGNGSTTQWNFSFVGVSTADLIVSVTNSSGVTTVLTPNTQYSVTFTPQTPNSVWSIGGFVTYPLTGSPLAVGNTLTIQRQVPYTQTTPFQNQGQFLPQAVETAVDLLTMQAQQLNTLFTGALVEPATDSQPLAPLPAAAARANNALCFDSTGYIPLPCSVLPASSFLVSGTPSPGWVPIATSSTTAVWGTTFPALMTFSAGISANAYNSTGGNYTFNGLSGVSGSPNIILNDVFVGTGQGGGVLFNALNSAAASVTSGYVNCGFSVNTAGSELGLCDQGYRAPSGVSQIITTAVNSSSGGCVLCSGNTDNFWTLGDPAAAWKLVNSHGYTVVGLSGSVSNPTPPIQMGTFFQSGNNCASHLAVNSTTYGFGVAAAGQLNVCSGGSIGFFPNGNGVSAPALRIDVNLHLQTISPSVPTVTSCGTGAVTAGSTDMAGSVTATGATACTLAFNIAYVTTPFCTLTDNTTAAALKGVPTTAGIAVTGLTSGDKFTYQCIAQSGG